MNEEKKKRRFGWRSIVFCFFALAFLLSSGVTASVLISRNKADKAIQELRIQARESLSGYGMTTAADPNAAQQPRQEQQAADAKEPAKEASAPKRQVSMDFTELQKANPDIIGWIFGEGTNVDYPILQAEDNDYYMDHLYTREYNTAGSIFADCRNKADFSDRNTVVFGHHMANGTMFGSIEHYKSQDFYDATPTMMLYTPDGDYRIELISGTHESGDEQFWDFNFNTEEEFLKYVESFQKRSTFKSSVEVQPGDSLISLCTCAYVFDNARFMLIGRLVPLYEGGQTEGQAP
ncbi:MAG: class B sortase [Oscillospiraceae bacterium]|nr:class B sortase [Oscillospiraceae bacterium]